jgi:hypothetical protein
MNHGLLSRVFGGGELLQTEGPELVLRYIVKTVNDWEGGTRGRGVSLSTLHGLRG